MNRAFSAACQGALFFLGRCPRLAMNATPLALHEYAASGMLLSYFFKLGAEHIHSPVGIQVTGHC
jgi:hypothetical protein